MDGVGPLPAERKENGMRKLLRRLIASVGSQVRKEIV
jgi:hypothetical protein